VQATRCGPGGSRARPVSGGGGPNGACKGHGVRRGEPCRRLAGVFEYSPGVGHHDRYAAGHRLQRTDTEWLPRVGMREHVAAGARRGNLLARERTAHRDPAAKRPDPRLFLEPVPQRTVADQHEPVVGAGVRGKDTHRVKK